MRDGQITIRLSVRYKDIKVPETLMLEARSPKNELYEPLFEVPIEKLLPATLSDVCDKFRANLFKAAGKEDPSPPTPAPAPLTITEKIVSDISARSEIYGEKGEVTS